MLLYISLLTSDHLWKMSEQILSCADMCPITFQSLFHALYMKLTCRVAMWYVRNKHVASFKEL